MDYLKETAEIMNKVIWILIMAGLITITLNGIEILIYRLLEKRNNKSKG